MTEHEFERLVREHQGVVCAVAYAVLRDRARSEEVAQEAFLLAWQRLPIMNPKPTMLGWVCGVARNLALNASRRRKETAVDAREAVVTETPLDNMLDRETEDLARAALGSLSQTDREVVTLYYRNDASVAEISGALGISESAVRQRLHRGRERLRSNLSAVEATLRATRPGPAFATACVAAAVATRGSVAHAAPKAAGLSAKTWLAIGIAALAAVATVTVVVAKSGRAASATPQPHESATAAVNVPPPPMTTKPEPGGLKRIAAADRSALLGQLKTQRGARTSAVGGGATTEPSKVYDFSGQRLDDTTQVPTPPPGTPLSKSTLRYAIVQMRPLLAECYAAAYDHLPHEKGTLEVILQLSGEPNLGTLVEDVDLGGDDALAKDPELSECVRETLFALELPPMTEGGTWQVNYPFVVSGTVSK